MSYPCQLLLQSNTHELTNTNTTQEHIFPPLDFKGQFDHFGVILDILGVFWRFLGYFCNFRVLRGYFDHFGFFKIYFQVILGILEILWQFKRFQVYFGHFRDVQCRHYEGVKGEKCFIYIFFGCKTFYTPLTTFSQSNESIFCLARILCHTKQQKTLKIVLGKYFYIKVNVA